MTATATATATMPLPRQGTAVELLNRLRAGFARVPTSLLTLAMRGGVGMVFWKSAMLKLGSWDTTLQLFADEYHLPLLPPEVAAVLGTTVELGGAILLFLGLFARFGALALLGLTATIQLLVYPENWPDHLLWAGPLAFILTRGPGKISLDHLVARRLGLG
jgi:putative oxidoreductase